jgi:long-chain acyl-CoA synthetase
MAVAVEVERPWLEHYPDGVPEHIDYPVTTIGRLLDDVAGKHPDADAIVFQGRTLSWGEIRRYSNQLAWTLENLGVRKGDRVVVLLANVPQFVISYYAVLKLGALVVATSPLFTESEIEAFMAKTQARVIITLDVLFDRVAESWQRAGIEHVLVGTVLDFMPSAVRFAAHTVGEMDSWLERVAPDSTKRGRVARGLMKAVEGRVSAVRRLREVPHPKDPIPYGARVRTFRSALIGRSDAPPEASIDPEDIAALLYTTGTTGTPKAAMLTHRSLISNAYPMRYWCPELQDSKETILSVLPLFHAYGLTLVMNAALVLAARSVLIPRPVLHDIFEAIKQFRPTALPCVPSLFVSIVNSDRTKKYDLRSIKICVSGGAPLPVEVKQRFDELTGGHLYEAYGLTEASPLTHAQPNDQSAPTGSIGFPVPDTDAIIVNDEGNILPQGGIGEMLIRGPQLMAGYFGEPDETEAVLRDGWLHTGDIAQMDEKGFFFIVDRKKDLIITGGENIAPREIEEVLYQHPKISEAAVTGVLHAHGGEIAKAFIVLRDGEVLTKAELLRWLEPRLAHYKIPRAVEFRDDLPKSPMGKILRRALAEEDAKRAAQRAASRRRHTVKTGKSQESDSNGSSS